MDDLEHYMTACGRLRDENKVKAERIEELETERETEVKHPIDSDGNIDRSHTYCYACGAGVKDQKYCQNCGRKLLWP